VTDIAIGEGEGENINGPKPISDVFRSPFNVKSVPTLLEFFNKLPMECTVPSAISIPVLATSLTVSAEAFMTEPVVYPNIVHIRSIMGWSAVVIDWRRDPNTMRTFTPKKDKSRRKSKTMMTIFWIDTYSFIAPYKFWFEFVIVVDITGDSNCSVDSTIAPGSLLGEYPSAMVSLGISVSTISLNPPLIALFDLDISRICNRYKKDSFKPFLFSVFL
jgi:hypothetical protein